MKKRHIFNLILIHFAVLSSIKLIECNSEDNYRRENPDIVYEIPFSASDHINFKLFDLKKCGFSISQGINFNYNARFLSHPWIARIGYFINGSIEYSCGGTLISDYYVLTTAHCLKLANKRLMIVRLGEYDTTKDIDCDLNDDENCTEPHQDVEVEHIIPHPNYKITLRPNQIQHDIGLIRLKTPARVNQDNIRPICLPFGSDSIDPGKNYISIGWAKMENEKRPVILQEEFAMQVDLRACQSRYRTINFLLNTYQLCAGNLNETVVSFGDLGDPLLAYSYINKKPRVVQFGVLTFKFIWSSGEEFPVIFTNTYSYLNWILDNMY